MIGRIATGVLAVTLIGLAASPAGALPAGGGHAATAVTAEPQKAGHGPWAGAGASAGSGGATPLWCARNPAACNLP